MKAAQFYIISSIILKTEIHRVKFKNPSQETELSSFVALAKLRAQLRSE
jgi:hypothetical protein